MPLRSLFGRYTQLFFVAGAEPAHEDDNEPLPVEPGRFRSTARGALYALHPNRIPAEGLRFREDDVQAAALSARYSEGDFARVFIGE